MRAKSMAPKGTYLLILRLDTDLTGLAIGRLGRYDFAAGYYLYLGSAFGAGGLAARLAHHRRAVKPHPHWHVDYLRACTHLIETWAVGSGMRKECCWTQGLAESPGLSFPVPSFGASDNGCVSHLLYSARRPALRLLTDTLLDSLARAGIESFTLEITSYEGA